MTDRQIQAIVAALAVYRTQILETLVQEHEEWKKATR